MPEGREKITSKKRGEARNEGKAKSRIQNAL